MNNKIKKTFLAQVILRDVQRAEGLCEQVGRTGTSSFSSSESTHKQTQHLVRHCQHHHAVFVCLQVNELIRRAKAWRIRSWEDESERVTRPRAYLLSVLVITAYHRVPDDIQEQRRFIRLAERWVLGVCEVTCEKILVCLLNGHLIVFNFRKDQRIALENIISYNNNNNNNNNNII